MGRCSMPRARDHLISCHQWVLSIDLFANEEADANVIVAATDSWTQQGEEVGHVMSRKG